MLEGKEEREIVLPRKHKIMPTAQDCRSFTGGAACPRHERCFGSDNRGLRILCAHVGHKRQKAVISRVTYLKRWHAALGRWTNQLGKGRPKVRQVQTSFPLVTRHSMSLRRSEEHTSELQSLMRSSYA